MPSVTVAHFHQLWAQLHNRAARDAYFVPSDAPDPEIELQWLARFANRIPCAGCRRHWLEVIASLPPDFSSRHGYFAWTVRAHNAINVRLGKPTMKLQAARRLWKFIPARARARARAHDRSAPPPPSPAARREAIAFSAV